MTLPKSLTTVTTISKLLALWLYLFLPFAGFYLGMGYQKWSDTTKGNSTVIQPTKPSSYTQPTQTPQVTFTIQEAETILNEIKSLTDKQIIWNNLETDQYGYSQKGKIANEAKSLEMNFINEQLLFKNGWEKPLSYPSAEGPGGQNWLYNKQINGYQYKLTLGFQSYGFMKLNGGKPEEYAKPTEYTINITKQYLENTPTPTITTFCIKDAQMCPDGSYVKRTGPNCEFALCQKMEP